MAHVIHLQDYQEKRTERAVAMIEPSIKERVNTAREKMLCPVTESDFVRAAIVRYLRELEADNG